MVGTLFLPIYQQVFLAMSVGIPKRMLSFVGKKKLIQIAFIFT
jgi:hypothetical protein